MQQYWIKASYSSTFHAPPPFYDPAFFAYTQLPLSHPSHLTYYRRNLYLDHRQRRKLGGNRTDPNRTESTRNETNGSYARGQGEIKCGTMTGGSPITPQRVIDEVLAPICMPSCTRPKVMLHLGPVSSPSRAVRSPSQMKHGSRERTMSHPQYFLLSVRFRVHRSSLVFCVASILTASGGGI